MGIRRVSFQWMKNGIIIYVKSIVRVTFWLQKKMVYRRVKVCAWPSKQSRASPYTRFCSNLPG